MGDCERVDIDTVVFHLRRRLRELEGMASGPSMPQMAQNATPYSERHRLVKEAEKQATVLNMEMLCLQEAIRIVELRSNRTSEANEG